MKEQNIRDFYRKWCEYYDAHMDETGHYKAFQKIINKLKGYIKGIILDINCGTGEAVSYILDISGLNKSVKSVVANDFSLDMLNIAKNKIKKKKHGQIVNFTNYDASDLDFSEGYFSVVICSYGIHWFKDKKKVLKEIFRVLSNGGIFISIEEFPPEISPSSIIKKYKSELTTAMNPIPPRNLERLFKEIGFIKLKRFKEKIISKKTHFVIVSVFKKI